MQDLTERIGESLAKEEAQAEQFANNVRLIVLVVLTAIALVNAPSVASEANALNFGALTVCYSYSIIVYLRIRRSGYRPAMKYITSCLDIILVFLLLFLYTMIEIPSVALKNYVFLVVFPLLALTAFRYDRTLTLAAGGLAVFLYLLLIGYLSVSRSVALTSGGYERELFSGEITYVGQLTKVFVLGGYVLLLASLGEYSRKLFARLVSEELSIRVQKELTDWELSVASQVQTQFLPRSWPAIAGLEIFGKVQQGRFVGGDYYDFMKLGDDKLLVVLADVSGKGVPAALIMSEVRASSHLIVSAYRGLEDFTDRLNALIFQSTDKKSFVTFFAAEIDTSCRTLTFVNAGHPGPLIYRGGEFHFLSRRTIALGLKESLPRFTVGIETFPPGSLFVGYTDGLLEQTDPRGDQYGEDRLWEYVRTHAELDIGTFGLQLFADLRAFGRGEELKDDVCIAVVGFCGEEREGSGGGSPASLAGKIPTLSR